MTGWRWLGSLVLFTGAALLLWQHATPAQDGKMEKLVWTAFDEKMVFYQTLTTTTKQTMKVNEMEVKQDQDQTFYIEWKGHKKEKKKVTVDKKEVEKECWVVSQKIIGVKMSIDIGGNKISFDSTEANPPQNPMSDFFNALKQAELKFFIDPDNFEVVEIDNVEAFRKKLTETNPQMDALLKNILSKEALKQMAEPTWAAFPPGGTASSGKSWTKNSKLDLGPIGIYNFDSTYTCEKDNPLKIKIKSTLTYKNPDPKAEGLPFKIKEGDLKTTEPGTGEATFDKDKGRFSSSTLTMKLSGNLKIDIGGTETTVHVQQTQDSTVKTSDENPIAKKK
jgi:Family of unknown function (DUF6263)